ncbi:hypothetical protein [Paenibacillus sp. FSL L8-0494]|uniref:hypothetical protein n=1 Tax=Paenibacillus sp. FSL L8-0494 TaxID=2975352 RepID=UPI0030FB8EE4
MGIWKMSQLKAPPLTDDVKELREYIKYLSNQLASMLKDLDFTLNGDVDFRNVRAKSIKADRMDVDELSAISANLGHIIAGLIESVEIYGSYISTNRNGFPRTEISNTDNLLRTSFDLNNYINYVANYANAPAIEFVTGGVLRARFSTIYTDLEIYAPNGITFTSPTNRFQNWSTIYNSDESKTLQDELNEIYDRLEALEGP